MAGIKISQLDSGGEVTSTDQLPVARDGSTTFRIPASQFVVNGSNAGTGTAQIFADKVTAAGTTLRFRSLAGEEGISLRTSGDTIFVSASGQNPSKTAFVGNGSRTIWTVNDAKSNNANNYRVTIDGIVQEPNVDYNINLANSTITFTSAPPLSGNIAVISNNLVRAFDVIPSDASVTFEKLVTSIQQALLPAGAVQPFAMNTAPAGWLAADGAAVLRSDYPTLFTAIGTNYGIGNGTTTFNVPDLRGYFVRGAGTNSDTIASGTFGAKQAQDWKSFTMTNTVQSGGNYSHNDVYMGKTILTYTGNLFTGYWSAPAAAIGTKWDTSEIRPANIAMLYCIKT